MIKPFLKYVAIFFVIYALLIALFTFTNLENNYTQAIANKVSSWGSAIKADAMIETDVKDVFSDSHPDVHLTISNQKLNAENRAKAIQDATGVGRQKISYDIIATQLDVNFWTYVSVPVLFLLSLILATPLQWRKKLRALLIGLVSLHLFILLKFLLLIIREFHKSHDLLQIMSLSDVGFSVLSFFYALMENVGFALFVSVIIWFVACFNFADIGLMLDRMQPVTSEDE